MPDAICTRQSKAVSKIKNDSILLELYVCPLGLRMAQKDIRLHFTAEKPRHKEIKFELSKIIQLVNDRTLATVG